MTDIPAQLKSKKMVIEQIYIDPNSAWNDFLSSKLIDVTRRLRNVHTNFGLFFLL